MVFETLYRVDPRGKSFTNVPDTEYYQPRIDREFLDGKQVFFVRETHGYFDDQHKKLVNRTFTLKPEQPEESFATLEEARRAYEKRLRYRAETGFVHAFSFDPFSQDGQSYRLLDPKAGSLLPT